MFYLIVILLKESTPLCLRVGLQYHLLSHTILHQSPLLHSHSHVQYLPSHFLFSQQILCLYNENMNFAQVKFHKVYTIMWILPKLFHVNLISQHFYDFWVGLHIFCNDLKLSDKLSFVILAHIFHSIKIFDVSSDL